MTKTRNTWVPTILIMFCSLATYSPLAAQDSAMMGKRMERIESMRIGYFTKHLELSPTEAQSFWPVYNEFQSSLKKLKSERRARLEKAKKNFSEMSDAQIEKVVDEEIEFRQQELDLRKQYHGKFKTVLPIKKVAKLYKIENEFKMEILKHARSQRQDAGNTGGSHRGVPKRGPHGF